MDDTKSTQYLLKLLQTKCDIIREWADKLRLKLDVHQNTMLDIIVSQADQIMGIANDYSKGNLSPETEEPVKDDTSQADSVSDVTSNDDHFGEEQAEGLADLLEGLRDTPHDDRW